MEQPRSNDVTKTLKWVVGFGVAVFAAGNVYAQDPVPGLQDLVGARGSSGEQALQDRGYTWVRTSKSANDSYTYWRENENGQCIAVRTTDGRYASIVLAPAFDCQAGAAEAPLGETGKGFATVCGVFIGRKDHPYRCTVEDHYQGARKTSTTLRFPDQTLTMVWKPGKQVELHFEGMVPKTVRYAASEGETNFVFEGKTYYYFSDQGRARYEVEHFRASDAADDGGGALAGASGTAGVAPTTATERVQFGAGATGAERTGTLTPGSSVRYVLGAKKQQFLQVRVAAQGPDIYYQIFNPDRSFLLDAITVDKPYRGQLWQSGDHVVEVINRGDRNTSFNVIFEID
jgi:hypothetical protein